MTTMDNHGGRRPVRMGLLAAAALALIAAPLVAAGSATAATPDGTSAIPTAATAGAVSDNAAAYAAASQSSDWVRTPGGLVNKSCVHHLATGSKLVNDRVVTATGQVQAPDTCAYPRLVKPGSADASLERSGAEPALSARAKSSSDSGPVPATNGWMAASWWSASTWFRQLFADFTVPNAPATAGATNFFFPSFEPSAGNAIVQPVLSYGGSAAGGGNYWYITSWYVAPGGTYYGNNVTVNSGDTIHGAMTANNCNGDGTNCQWTITTTDDNGGGTSTLNVTTPESYSTAQGGVYESYGVSDCSMMPSSNHIGFSNISMYGPSLEQLTPAFGQQLFDTTCGVNESHSNTTTDITWGS